MIRKFMTNKYHQFSLKNTLSHYANIVMNDVLFSAIGTTFRSLSLYSPSLSQCLLATACQKRVYPLTIFISTLIRQKIFFIPTDSLLMILLNTCKEF